MKIGIPTEVKVAERRVALTPRACKELVKAGHEVYLQKNAGKNAGYPDSEYEKAGVKFKPDAKSLYAVAELIVKVKEPQPEEYRFIRPDHKLFCYLHLASDKGLVRGLQKSGCTAIAFETVVEDGKTPLLAPMSAIAGRLAVQIGTWLLHAPRGGRGVLLGGFSGFKSGKVTVIGAGVAGTEAAILAHNMGAEVTVLDINKARLQELAKAHKGMQTMLSTPQAIASLLPTTDLLVGSVYVIGRRAPVVVSAEMVKTMPQGSVLVDISIDQGGCIATAAPCTHEAPKFVQSGVIHSCITNLPAAAPHTASQALSEAIVSYVRQLASGRPGKALKEAVNVKDGELKILL